MHWSLDDDEDEVKPAMKCPNAKDKLQSLQTTSIASSRSTSYNPPSNVDSPYKRKKKELDSAKEESTPRYKLREKEKIKSSLLVEYQLGKFRMQVLPLKQTSDLELPSTVLVLFAATLKTVLRGHKLSTHFDSVTAIDD